MRTRLTASLLAFALFLVTTPTGHAQVEPPNPGNLSTRSAGPEMQLTLAVGDYLSGQVTKAEASLEELLTHLAGDTTRLRPTIQYCLGLIYLERAFYAFETIENPTESAPGTNALEHLEQAALSFERVIGSGDAYAEGVHEALMGQVGTYRPMFVRRSIAILERALPLYDQIPEAAVDGFRDVVQLLLGIAYLSLAIHEESTGECLQSDAALRLSQSYFDRVSTSSGFNTKSLKGRYDRIRRETNPAYPAFGFALEPLERGWERLLDFTEPAGQPLIDLHVASGYSIDREPIRPGLGRPVDPDRNHDTDGLFRLNAAVDVTWELLKGDYRESDEPGWGRLEIGTGWSTRNRWYNDVEEADYHENRGSLFVNWLPEPARPQNPGLLWGMRYSYIASEADSGSLFRTHRFVPSVTAIWKWKPYGEGYPREALDHTRLYATYDLRDDREELPRDELDRDGDSVSLAIEHHAYPWRADELFYLAPYFESVPARRCAYEDEYLKYFVRARIGRDRTTGNEYEGMNYTVAAGAELPLWWRFAGDAGVRFTWRGYANPSDFAVADADDRSEQAIGFSGGLSWRMADMDTMTARLRIGAGYYANDSNFNLYEYDRSMYTLQLEIGFGPHPRKGPDYSARKGWLADPDPEDGLGPIVE